MQDSETLFFGPKKHIQDLWDVIDSQKEYILILESQLRSLGAQPQKKLELQAPLAQPGTQQVWFCHADS